MCLTMNYLFLRDEADIGRLYATLNGINWLSVQMPGWGGEARNAHDS